VIARVAFSVFIVTLGFFAGSYSTLKAVKKAAIRHAAYDCTHDILSRDWVAGVTGGRLEKCYTSRGLTPPWQEL